MISSKLIDWSKTILAFMRRSLTFTLIVLFFLAPIAITESETYTEGDSVPVILRLSNPIATGFTVEWEVKPGPETEGTPADTSDYSGGSGSRVITPDDGLRIHLDDIRLIDDKVVEGPEIFDIHLTGVLNTALGVDPTKITLGDPRRITIVDKNGNTGDEINDDTTVLLPPDPPEKNNDTAEENWTSAIEKRKRTRRHAGYCPVGWRKYDGFGNLTPRVILHAVEVAMDIEDRSGIYKPVAIEIYADPTEDLSNLAGWKLTVARLYNHGTDYQLTAENSTFNDNGIARIESPSEAPFPLTDVQWSGQWLPGFDYRLFDENNVVVDFGISCYRHARLQDRLQSMERPRLERDIIPPALNDEDLERSDWRERLDWTKDYYLSIYLVPKVAPAAPGAPAAVRMPLTTSWAALKGEIRVQN